METRSTFYNTLLLFFNIGLLVVFALLITNNIQISYEYSINKQIIYFYSIILYFYLIMVILLDALLEESHYEFGPIFMIIFIPIIFLFPTLTLPRVEYVDDSIEFVRFLFWFSISTWTILTSVIFKKDQVEGVRTNFLTYISIFWLFLCLFTTIGSEIYDFSIKPIEELTALTKFTDIRVLVGILVITFITCKAIIKSFNAPISSIKMISKFQIPYVSNNLIAFFLQPLVLIFNIIFSFLIVLLNTFWRIAAFISLCAARLFYNIILEINNQYFRFIYIKLMLIFILIYCSFLVGDSIENADIIFREYLEQDSFEAQKNLVLTTVCVSIVILALFITKFFVYVTLISDTEYSFYGFLRGCGKTFTTIFQMIIPKIVYLMAALWVSGLVLLGFSNIEILGINHFKQIGPYTFGMSCFIFLSGLIYSLSFLFKKDSA